MGLAEEAARLFISSGLWEELARLILREAQSFLRQGRFSILDELLTTLSSEILEGNPWLQFFAGAARFPRDPSTSKFLFERALHKFQETGDAAGAFLSWSGVMEAIAFRAEDVVELDEWIPKYNELVSRFGEELPAEIDDRVSAAMFTALTLRAPDHPDFSQWETRALRVIRDSPDMDLKAKVLFHRTLYLQDRGLLNEAEESLVRFRAIIKHEEMTPLASLFFRLADVHQKHFSGSHKECLLCVDDALEFAQNSGVHVLDSLLAGHGAWSCLQENDLNRSRNYLTFIEGSSSFLQPFSRGFYLFLKAYEALLSGELHNAREYSEQNIAISKRVGYLGSTLLSLELGAHVAFELGDSVKAHRLLEEAGEYERRLGEMSMSHRFNLLLTISYIAFEENDASTGYNCLREALKLGNSRGFCQAYVWRPRVMVNLCIKALEAGIETEYVRTIITKATLIPDAPPVHVEEWPWPLKIYTMGRFGILRDDAPLRITGRAQKKPLEMLRALIAAGGRQVREVTLTDLLWPDAEGDAAHNAFTTTLARLRKLLGSDGAVQLREGKVTLSPTECWVDAWAFERIVSQANTAWEGGHEEQGLRSSRRAFRMYTGEFLAGEDEHWVLSPRERLKSKFLRNALRLGGHLEEAGRWDEAMEYYRRCLEVDELMEEFYRRLMRCCMELGRKAEGITVYRQCCDTLDRVLGVQPSRETSSLYHRLSS
jgi:DNA-binding SARP family transcriptional activator